ncbi:MAG TPA: response regulator [Kouleothrix sp.]|uniref:response regulator transcription factor n=1 Tax=Kouleothrix sp. TaxID=2779161 RepID=UPI002CFD83FD|nr:response regulator [Kouleothrix sp.]
MSLPTSPAVTNGSAPSVLIVEDDAATRRLYKFMLTNGGYPVIEAEDGVAALEQLAKHPCELVITDMNMPRMDGMELIQAIRRDYSDVYVILITAFGTPDTEKQARRIGANDYLAKPFDFEELERRVRLFFESRPRPA